MTIIPNMERPIDILTRECKNSPCISKGDKKHVKQGVIHHFTYTTKTSIPREFYITDVFMYDTNVNLKTCLKGKIRNVVSDIDVDYQAIETMTQTLHRLHQNLPLIAPMQLFYMQLIDCLEVHNFKLQTSVHMQNNITLIRPSEKPNHYYKAILTEHTISIQLHHNDVNIRVFESSTFSYMSLHASLALLQIKLNTLY